MNVSPPQPTVKKRQSLMSLPRTDVLQFDPTKPGQTSDGAALVPPPKKRWSMMGRKLPGALPPDVPSITSSQGKPKSPTMSHSTSLDSLRLETGPGRTNADRPLAQGDSSNSSSSTSPGNGSPPTTAGVISYRAFCFKFSLEWAQHFEKPPGFFSPNPIQPQGITGPLKHNSSAVGLRWTAERRLIPPRLPAPAQNLLGTKIPGLNKEVLPCDPAAGVAGVAKTEKLKRAKYSGRALAEWMLVVCECNNFVERRRAEGVPNLKCVEVPTLGVEGFRKFGG